MKTKKIFLAVAALEIATDIVLLVNAIRKWNH